MPNGQHRVADLPPEDRPEGNDYIIEYCFPIGTFEELVAEQGYTDVQVTSDREEIYSYDVIMRSPDVVDRAAVRQHLKQAVRQIPETPRARLKWRVELSAVIVLDKRVAAQIRVAYIQMAH